MQRIGQDIQPKVPIYEVQSHHPSKKGKENIFTHFIDDVHSAGCNLRRGTQTMQRNNIHTFSDFIFFSPVVTVIAFCEKTDI